ncbi:hypothetical protein DUZ99_13170 [Xylanibacillus composti]|uniref:Uncharacterized protein n=1 Tax=Xylanibacillus composti TaxID=1572762 RepID=A0A8J4H9B4_9BACL|nr:hypothetical protein [Xylanibacillus composti]MDT9725925.1 hypothetical protein [Xylanibacillus composti]GIQ71238.1 hypothetical protein XYCOK13_40620 [Xylanibacillus composti]
MVEGMLLILSIYGLSILAVHVIYAGYAASGKETAHFVLVCRDNEQQLEWIVRTLRWFHWLHGKSVDITLIDQGSADQTMEMAAKMEDEGWVRLNRLQTAGDYDEYERLLAERTCLVLNLNRREDLASLSFLQ